MSNCSGILIEQGAEIMYDIGNFLKNTGIVSDSEIMEKKLDKLLLAKEERLVYSNLDFSPKFIDIIFAGIYNNEGVSYG